MNPFQGHKLYYHTDRLAEWLTRGDTILPVTVEIDMTDRCTDSCPHCAGGRGKNTPDAQPARIKRLLEELVGVGGVIFTGGGEPLVHSATLDMIRHAHKLGIETGLITNGVLLDPATQWGALSSLTWVKVSLDACDATMYKRMHGTKNFDRVLKNIRNASAMKGQGDKPTLGVGYLVDKSTIWGMVKAAELCASLGVDHLHFRPLHSVTDKATAVLAAQAFSEAQVYRSQHYAVVWSAHKFERLLKNGQNKRYKTCYGHAFAATIQSNGDVVLCCHTRGNPKYVLGNIYESSFEEIWQGERRRYVIEHIDFADCVALCRCDPFNEILWNLREEPAHVNFL